MSNYITTHSKIHFTVTEPKIEDIKVEDIAHALSLICRANGHFQRFFSVAQHCINCAVEAQKRGYSNKVQLACLLHDASEAYLSDITRPLKSYLPQYLCFEEKLQTLVYDKFLGEKLTDEEQNQVCQVDDSMMYYEFVELMGEKVFDTVPELSSCPNFETRDFKAVEKNYLNIYSGLTQKTSLLISPNRSFSVVGIDGCMGKWLTVAITESGFDINLISSIEEVCDKYQNADCIIIDMPIGLAEKIDDKRPDTVLRGKLKGKASSVFNTPCRQAVYENTYEKASEINRNILAKGISKQSYAIIPKIREIDEFLQANNKWKNRLLESHPEFCFAKLNDGLPILENKQTQQGAEIRIELLSEYYPESYEVVEHFKRIAPASLSLKIDDVIDALVLAVTGIMGLNNGFISLPENPPKDSTGVIMQIVSANLERRI